MNTHEQFIQRCLDLAVLGLANVAPNPMVGCVIVHEGKVIAEGYHQKFGEAHAEVNALKSVANQELLKESTLYVNLEPCSHHGKTPPCADLILQMKIPRVVIGSYDPNLLVSGKGIQKLKEAGVEVVTDVMKKEADFMNRRFITFHTKHRPYIILKWAQSADGLIALNEQKQYWLTNSESKKLTHKWRTEEQGILVGANTVAVDDCELTARLWQGKNPMRAVIDRKLVLPADRKIFNGEAVTLIFNEMKTGERGSNRYIWIDFNGNVVGQILQKLYELQIQSLIVEGGPYTLNRFLEQGLWDEARIFVTAQQLKEGKTAPVIKQSYADELEIEKDVLRTYFNTSA